MEEREEEITLGIKMIPESFEVEEDGELIWVKKGIETFKKEVLEIISNKRHKTIKKEGDKR